MIRIDKFLADAGIGTRSEVKNYIKKKRVRIDEVIISDPSIKLDENSSCVYVDNEPVSYEKYHYYILNKPMGCVSATKDKLSETVIELLKGEPVRDLFPVGRLDKDTEGLLIITNDGMAAHNLLSPRKHVYKTYLACVSVRLDSELLESFATGLDIGDDKMTLPATIEEMDTLPQYINPDVITNVYEAVYRVTICEGRYHQIKRMFEACNSSVVYLRRQSMGEITLEDELENGCYRRLTDKELTWLRSLGKDS